MSSSHLHSNAPPVSPMPSAITASSGIAIDQADDARQDQHFVRIDADGVQRVDFLVEFHRADFGGEGAARAAGNNDGGEQHAELAQHADGDDVDHEDFRAVVARLLGGDVGDDQRDQEGDQRDDGNRGDAGFVDVPRDRGGPQPPPAGAGAQRR